MLAVFGMAGWNPDEGSVLRRERKCFEKRIQCLRFENEFRPRSQALGAAEFRLDLAGRIRCELHRRGATALRIGCGRTVPCWSGLAIDDDRAGLGQRQYFCVAKILEQAEGVAV